MNHFLYVMYNLRYLRLLNRLLLNRCSLGRYRDYLEQGLRKLQDFIGGERCETFVLIRNCKYFAIRLLTYLLTSRILHTSRHLKLREAIFCHSLTAMLKIYLSTEMLMHSKNRTFCNFIQTFHTK